MCGPGKPRWVACERDGARRRPRCQPSLHHADAKARATASRHNASLLLQQRSQHSGKELQLLRRPGRPISAAGVSFVSVLFLTARQLILAAKTHSCRMLQATYTCAVVTHCFWAGEVDFPQGSPPLSGRDGCANRPPRIPRRPHASRGRSGGAASGGDREDAEAALGWRWLPGAVSSVAWIGLRDD